MSITISTFGLYIFTIVTNVLTSTTNKKEKKKKKERNMSGTIGDKFFM